MNAATDFDLGPLTWVKGEIDLALQRAGEALEQFAADGDPARLRLCRNDVHQAHGALAMVGLDGVTQVTESLELLLAALEDERIAAGAEAAGTARRALAELRQYLDDLLAGEPHRPLRLLGACQALATARGEPLPHASELFFPDLSRRPPRREAAGAPPDADSFRQLLKGQRLQFQKGLLGWLKKPAEADAGRVMMRDAVAAIEAAEATPAARSFWWVSLAFLEALADPALAADPFARQLCSRIDAQIRRLIDGGGSVAERVLREALYFVALAPAGRHPLIDEVARTFDLPDLLPADEPVAAPQPHEAALRRLRETLGTAEELWNKFCTGHAASLPAFAADARVCAGLTADIGQTDLKRLGQGLAAIAGWLTEAPGRFSDGVAMEVATAILLLQNAQENFKRLGTDFAQQVDLMVERLHACIAGRQAAESDLPLLDEMTRRAQEKLLIGQVGREIQNNLAQIEQALDAFFRDPARAHELGALDAPLKQVGGALAMLGHFGAVARLRECGERIRQFAAPEYVPAAADFEQVASQLSLIGFFVEALQGGETDFDAYVRRLGGQEAAAETGGEAGAPASLETQLAGQAKATQALAEALREAPADERLQQELKQNLQAIQKDADLVADRGLGASATAALAALQSGAPVDAALAALAPSAPPVASAAARELAEAGSEAIDAELLAIFLEEAREVLATMAEHKARLAANPGDLESLTTIRRGTHTLKGSGRMVGLTALGEAAWEVEQTFNLWLRQDQPATPELMAMIDGEHALFSAWIAELEAGGGSPPDPSALVALAARLRGVEPAAAPAVAPVADIEAAAPAIEAPAVDEAVIDIDLPVLEEEVLLPTADIQLQLTAEALSDLLVAEPEAEAEAEAVPEPEPEPEPELEPELEPEPPPAAPTLFDIFCEEARGHLTTLVETHAALDAEPGAPTAFAMTRAAHTLGGIAATVGLMPLHHLAIALEHALLRRDASAHPDSIEGLETVRRAIMTLQSMFDGLALQRAPEEEGELIAALGDVFPPLALAPETSGGAEIIPLPGVDRRPAPVEPVEPVAAPAPAPTPAVQLTDELDEQLLPIFLEEAADQLRDLTAQLRAWRDDPAGAEAPQAIARLLHTFKGNARMAGAMNLGEFTHQLETRVDEARRGSAVDGALIDEIEAGCDALGLAVERLGGGAAAPAPVPAAEATAVAAPAAGEAPAEAETGAQATLRVRADLVDRLVNEAGELSIARARIEGEMRSLKTSLLDLTENVIRLRRQLRDIEIQAESQIQARVAQSGEHQPEFDPLELDRFTRFQELTRFMAESVNDVATVQQNLLKNLDDANAAILAQARLNRSLQQELMGVRMLPFASQAERLYRIVRQTAKEVGKRARLDIVGGQVEIDRSVLDKMMAPLEHMLRNAVTHGIESREQRAAVDKPEAGEITLTLAQEGNEIIVTLADDGQGLNGPRIRARAEVLGLLQPGEAVDDATLHDFIFRPGFSTADELSQVAGRGVGMDVVKTEVGALGGRIEIQSETGRGTRFRLYLPLTLAVTQTLLVRAGSALYAVPSTMIEQVLELKEKPLAELRAQGEAVWQERHYPYHFLPHLLGDPDALPEAHRQYWVLMLRSGSQRVAVQVDELKGNQEVVVKNIGPQLARVVGIDGATVLGDGQVVLIINPVALAGRAPATRRAAPVAAVAAPAPHLPTVMVVDDSLTVRKITSRLLAREGYQVLLAKDGVDALEQLVDLAPDVILSDIEMPRMDGFDFVRNLRADDRLRDIPVIMITSRTADKHRNYALEIGANHYLGKPYDEEELLRLVAGYCGKSA